MRIALVFYRFGPYHLARLLAARKLVDAIGIEFTSRDHVYQWEKIQLPEGVSFYSFFTESTPLGFPTRAIYEKALHHLSEVRPHAVAIPGWGSGFALTMLRAAHALGIPATIMSESQRIDFPRTQFKEWIKRRLVGLYSSAIVGGQPHKEYMAELGMNSEAIFRCMDAVDNDHFAVSRMAVNGEKRTFLASARFVEKKNLIGLLTAYRLYRNAIGESAWNLTILGDGPLKNQILGCIRQNQLEKYVFLPGFVQYADLPAHYANASVFVHASTSEQWGLVVNEAMAAGLPVLVSNRCGCARDLVEPGVNGFTFNPFDYRELAAHMVRVTSTDGALELMGQASREIISKWGVDRFAEQIVMAARYAIEHPAPRASKLQLRGLDLLAKLI